MINLQELHLDVDCDTPFEEFVEEIRKIKEMYPLELKIAAHFDIVLEPIKEWEKKKEEK